MSISASDVRDLRSQTGAGMMDCKKALQENNGDFEQAIDWLRKKGITKAAKKAGRITAEGLVHAYIHGGRVGVLLEVNSETDFVARNEDFKTFVQNIAMHIAAMNPQFVKEDEISEAVRDKERQVLIAKNLEEGKKEEMVDKIVTGQLKKWAAEICLMNQKYVKNPDLTIEQYLQEAIGKIGENIVIRRFTRWELGEGLEKRSENFAEEVAAQLNKE